ncbi:type I restriction endonuclease subunit R [Candidatus Sumerlaeota bacterium]|nr:type I restriction endonuclease subunit R [Candidatus Sumerlaeota bacterium]
MTKIHTEQTFESAIIQSLVQNGGYTETSASDFNREICMDTNVVLSFLEDSQPLQWKKLKAAYEDQIENRIIERLNRELDLRGTLDVLRNGIKDYGVKFQMAFFKPETRLNPETQALYDKNRLTVTRQLKYSAKNENSIDLLLGLNGLPIATIELKNPFTRQTVENAKIQYMEDRDPRELLFQFKKRALVHFAVDTDEVFMTTRLQEKRTKYLPFNLGFNNGAGNPPNPEGYKTAYLWEYVWTKHSWMDIIARFLHIQSEEIEDKNTGKKYKKESLIFPRFHQLDVVRNLSLHAKENGTGRNYLIQHSAGSGKSNSIAWLSYHLSSLHNAKDERIFDSVVVVTDRLVLDQQLQNTIYQFEHKQGVVQKIDQNSEQLAQALGYGKHIIITTLQKFPFIVDKVKELPGKNYAVIVDEAHSSQGGEAARKMKAVLSAKNLEEAAKEDGAEFEDEEDVIREEMKAIGPQPNLSFFAFTATPKSKTLEVFGEKDAEGKPRPFHLYSMRQAIEEGFILDVLKNYTTYKAYFRIAKAIEDDPELNKRKAAKAIGSYVSLHPYNLAQKTQIMIEHFKEFTSKKIGGKAKAMVVTSSRLHAKRYYFEFKKYIKEKGYDWIKVLVAFSGSVKDDDFPDGVSESQLTHYGEKELPEIFEKEEYKILIVAEKYQTGYDQPLLHTMFVDKPLSGVKAVQTLSRLNRINPGKEDTFILDFVNDRETILQSFQPFYEATILEETTDPNHLYDLKNKLDEKQVYWQSEIDAFARVYYLSRNALNPGEQGKLYAFIDPSIQRYKGLNEEEQDEFKKGLRTWTNIYSYLSQIIPFQDIELEKFFTFGRHLSNRLPKRDLSERLKLTDEVALEYYRLQKISDGAITLEIKGEVGLQNITEAGIKREKEEKALLSEIINVLNDRFGTDFTDADKLFFDQIEMELVRDEKLQMQAKSNSLDNFKYGFDEAFLTKLIDRMEDNKEIFARILDDKDFGGVVKEWMLRKVYQNINAE